MDIRFRADFLFFVCLKCLLCCSVITVSDSMVEPDYGVNLTDYNINTESLG